MEYYLVGGAVRDMLLGRRPNEFDIVFSGGTADLLREKGDRAHTVGKDMPIHIVNGHEHVSLYGGNIAADLARRDFTINALALDENGLLYFLPETLSDLAAGILRHASLDSFSADFVRVLRAARFLATLDGFAIHPDTLQLMRRAAQLPGYGLFAPERAGREFMKALGGHTPSAFLQTLRDAKALSPWFNPMQAALRVPAGPVAYHGDDSVFHHTCTVMDITAARSRDARIPTYERTLAVWMAFCHDLGKLETETSLLPSHWKHETRGLDLAVKLAGTLKLPGLWSKAARLAIELHMKAGRYISLRPGTKVDLLHRLKVSGLFRPFCVMVSADSRSVSASAAMQKDMAALSGVSLPPEWQNRGPESAGKLRELRIRALAATHKLNP